MHLTQADLAEFSSFRTNLNNLTTPYRKSQYADTRPAYAIFNRFHQRIDERVAYISELLKTEDFTFNTDESVTLNRKDEPAPLDLTEARQLWRQRLRSEYLGEKVGKYAAKKKKERDAIDDKKKSKVVKKSDESTKVDKDAPKKTEAEEIVDTITKRYNRISHFYGEFDQDNGKRFQ